MLRPFQPPTIDALVLTQRRVTAPCGWPQPVGTRPSRARCACREAIRLGERSELRSSRKVPCVAATPRRGFDQAVPSSASSTLSMQFSEYARRWMSTAGCCSTSYEDLPSVLRSDALSFHGTKRLCSSRPPSARRNALRRLAEQSPVFHAVFDSVFVNQPPELRNRALLTLHQRRPCETNVAGSHRIISPQLRTHHSFRV